MQLRWKTLSLAVIHLPFDENEMRIFSHYKWSFYLEKRTNILTHILSGLGINSNVRRKRVSPRTTDDLIKIYEPQIVHVHIVGCRKILLKCSFLMMILFSKSWLSWQLFFPLWVLDAQTFITRSICLSSFSQLFTPANLYLISTCT